MKTNGQDTPTAPKPRPRRKPHGPERLKPERVQLRIESLPGWTLRPGGRAIARYYSLPDTAQALAFLDAVQALGRSQGRLPQVASGRTGRSSASPLRGRARSRPGITSWLSPWEHGREHTLLSPPKPHGAR